MSHLSYMEKLLDGADIKWKPLWQVTIWDKKFNAVERFKQPKVINYQYLLAADLFKLEQEGGDVFLLSTGERTGWTTEALAGSYLREGEVVTIPWGKSRPVRDVIKYYKGRFVTADNRIATSNNTEELLNKYLYYWLMSQSQIIDSYYRGSGIQHPSMADVLDILIPLPSIEIQAEIVRILDAFTALTAELTAELNMRKKQYNYYRDQLLSFEEGEVEWKTLLEVCDYVDYRGKTPQKTASGIFLVTAKNIRMGYIDYEASQEFIDENDYSLVMRRGIPKLGDVLITTEAPCGFVAQVDRENIALAQRVIKYRSKDSRLSNSFLKHYLLGGHFQKKLHSAATGSTVKGIKGSKLHQLTIPIPSEDEQARIVAILDKFDALTNSITEGLPREIELRQKQYEYYRDLLLSFPKSHSDEAA